MNLIEIIMFERALHVGRSNIAVPSIYKEVHVYSVNRKSLDGVNNKWLEFRFKSNQHISNNTYM